MKQLFLSSILVLSFTDIAHAVDERTMVINAKRNDRYTQKVWHEEADSYVGLTGANEEAQDELQALLPPSGNGVQKYACLVKTSPLTPWPADSTFYLIYSIRDCKKI